MPNETLPSPLDQLSTTTPFSSEQGSDDFRFLAELVPQIVWSAQPDGAVDYFNARWVEFTGRSLEMSLGTELWNPVLHPEDLERTKKVWSDSLISGQQYEIEYRFKEGSSGLFRWFLGRAIPQRNKQGEIIRWYGTCTDIHELRNAREQLRSANERSVSVMEGLPSMAWSLNETGTPTYYSQRWSEFTGASNSILIAGGIVDFIHPEDLPEVISYWEEQLLKGGRFQNTYRLRNAKGEYRWHTAVGEALRNESGEVLEWVGTTTDVHESVETNLAIKRQSEHMQALMEALPHIFWTATPKGAITHTNSRWDAYMGNHFGPSKGLGWTKYVHPEDLPHVVEIWKRHILSGSAKDEIYRFSRKDGQYRWQNVIGIPVKNEEGEIVEWVGTITDIHDLREATTALEVSAERFQNLLEAVPSFTWTTDKSGMNTFVSKRWLEYTGQTLEQSLGTGFYEVIYPDDLPKIKVQNQEDIDNGRRFSSEHRIRSTSGTYRWFSAVGEPFLNSDGDFEGYIGATTDIHDAKMATENLAQSALRVKTLLESLPQMAWVCDKRGACTYINSRWPEYTERPLEDLLGSGWMQDLHPDDIPLTSRSWTKAVVAGTKYRCEFRIRRSDGHYRWFLASGVPMLDKEGNISQWIGTTTDIHDQRIIIDRLAAAKDELTKANNDLRRLNNDLDTFVYIASHDLKAPAINLDSLVSALESEFAKPQDQQQDVSLMLTMLKTTVLRFRNTIQDLTDIAKVQRSAPEDVTDLEIADMLPLAIADIHQDIKQANAEIVLDIEQAPTVHFSRGQLRSILFNLLSNAVKYRHPDRTPIINVRSHQVPGYIVISVKDNGLGIPEVGRDKLFQMFKRLHSHVDGSGVGLYIVKRAVENVGGKVTYNSVLGEGSEFHVFFPAAYLD